LGGNGFWPLLGVIFAPCTTVMYLLVCSPGLGIYGWYCMWIGLGVMLELVKWAQIAQNRRGIPGYPEKPPTSQGEHHGQRRR
jgi:hypothetical protein